MVTSDALTHEKLKHMAKKIDDAFFDAAVYNRKVVIGGNIITYPVTNPCSEIDLGPSYPIYPNFRGNEIRMNKDIDRTPHSRRTYERGLRADGQMRGDVSGRGISAQLEINDYNVLISMDVPGVEQERISVRRIDDILRVTIRPENAEEIDVSTQQYNSKVLEYILDPLEVVEIIELDLGVLTIVTTRGTDVEDYEID